MRFRLVLAVALIFATGACAQLQSARVSATEPTISDDGFYRIPTEGGWCREYCELGRHYVNGDIEFYATPSSGAPVIDHLTPGEWVLATELEVHTRLRGVVRQAGEGYEVGDVVYLLDSLDYEYWLWRRGDVRLHQYDECDEDCPDEPPTGLVIEYQGSGTHDEAQRWMHVEREGGRRSGWIRDANLPSVERVIDTCSPVDISAICSSVRAHARPVTASFQAPRPFSDCAECPSMVRIPGHSFAVSQYELTFAQWDACMAAGACEQRHQDRSGSNFPVTNVSWIDAQAYVLWLSQRTGHHYRLLTTDEWVIAAYPGGRRQNYYWGNDRPTCERGARNGVAFDACHSDGWPLPVGSFQPNAYGLCDMIGNVGEWLEDRYSEEESPDFKALIGSSWASNEESLGGRGGAYSGASGPDTGIRVARDR